MKGSAVLLILWFVLLSNCYLLKQGTYILKYNNRAQPIERVLSRDDLEEDARAMLALVQEIKSYAVHSLTLKENKNYSRYLSLERQYLVDVVSACAKDAFEPYIWRYPVAGSFPYKGFYERDDALKEAARLKKKDLDVLVRKTDAFSTLGIMSDPIYSFMSDYSVFALASLIIHEQTHATVFFKNQVQFNEELATFMGWEGALSFIAGKYGQDAPEYREARGYIHDWRRYSDLVNELHRELDQFYRNAPDREYALRERGSVVEAFNREHIAEPVPEFETEGFRALQGIPVNNAYIMSFVRYTQDLDVFYRLYDAVGHNLKTVVELLKQLKVGSSKGSSPQEALRRLI